ncbi:MAG: TonB-dependent hemoglobin/transferrin/lactoferrin family receptor [Pseudomonadota bacterium]
MKGKITNIGGALLLAAAGLVAAEESSQRLQETIIGSQKDERPSQTLGTNQLVRQMTHNIEDTVRYIPGVQVNDTGNRFNDDGFNMRGLEGDAINVNVDGIRQGETLNPPSFAPYGMFGSSRGAIEVETVKEVRITKGPNAVAVGNGALAGSVTYETKEPADLLQGDDNDTFFSAKAGYDGRSDENLLTASFANRTGALETMLIVVNRDGHETEAHDDGDSILGAERGQADPADREETTVLAKLNYNFTDNQLVGLVFEKTVREAQVTPLSRQSLPYYDFYTDDTSDRDRIGIKYAIEDSSAPFFDNLEVRADYQWLYTRGETNFVFSSFSTLMDPSDDYLRTEDRAFGQRSYTFAAEFEEELIVGDTSHQLYYGFEYEQGLVSNRLFDIRRNTPDINSGLRSYTVDPTWVPDTELDRWSVYLRDEFNLTDNLEAFAGVRFEKTEYGPEVDSSFPDPTGDVVNDSEYDTFVGEFGLTWKFTDTQSVAFAMGQGFKGPTTQDLYLDAGAEILTDIITGAQFNDYDEISNPNLEAETATNYEVAYTYDGERAFVRVNAFVSEYDELIQSVSQTSPYGTTYTYLSCSRFGCNNVTTDADEFVQARNVGAVDISGFEVESRFALGDTVELQFAYSHLDSEHKSSSPGLFDDGDELATAAPDSASLGVSYDAPSERWGASAFLVWTNDRGESNQLSFQSLNNGGGPAQWADSWTTVDLFAFYQFERGNTRLSLAVRNLFDEDYVRWEVINGVRSGTGGFFAGVAGDGWQRFTEPGRSFSLNISAEF